MKGEAVAERTQALLSLEKSLKKDPGLWLCGQVTVCQIFYGTADLDFD